MKSPILVAFAVCGFTAVAVGGVAPDPITFGSDTQNIPAIAMGQSAGSQVPALVAEPAAQATLNAAELFGFAGGFEVLTGSVYPNGNTMPSLDSQNVGPGYNVTNPGFGAGGLIAPAMGALILVPEPMSLSLLGVGALGLLLRRKR
ncbi:MAG: PEP-CTERM sorting domain-containing protein [Phycisphaerales bacterium]|nr:PEP-CTERM sorting domain-containing protein [Phycisphaerales bacterium]